MADGQTTVAARMSRVRGLVDGFAGAHGKALAAIGAAGEAVVRATQVVGESWGGSWAGYHARLYYRDFRRPPLSDRFDVEWGGIDGLPDGRTEKTPEAVKTAVERLAGPGVSIGNLEAEVRRVRKELERLQREVVVESAIIGGLPGLEREQELFVEIEGFKLGATRLAYASSRRPRSVASRDSTAMFQGIVLPAHISYEALGHEAQALASCGEGFLDLVDRAIRQIEGKLSIEGGEMAPQAASPAIDTLHGAIEEKCRRLFEQGHYAEAVERGFKVVRDRLRALTGFERGADAFGRGGLHVAGAAAPHVDEDFNEGVKFLTMAIDRFRNEKSHTSDAEITDWLRAYEYLRLSSLAMHLLDKADRPTPPAARA